MAEAARVQEKSLEELKGEITCAICQEHYTEPKTLPCLHYYCKQCVLQLALRTDTKKAFSCPECRSPATLPEGGVDQLKTAFFINRLKSKVSALERSHGKVEVWCELCEGSSNSARAFCRQCARFICQECVDLHKRIATFKSHEVATLDDLKHGRAKPVPVQEAPTEKCLVHEESLTIYCYDCDRLVCRDCTLKDHREHNFEFTKKATPTEKNKLLEEVKPLKDLHTKLTNAVENIRTTKVKIETQRDSTINVIKASFMKLHAILEEREKELVENTEAVVQEKVDKLSVQEKTLSLASAEVRSAVDYTEQSVRHCTNNEVMSMLSEMRKTIRQKIQEHSKSERNLEPVEVADMGVEVGCAEALRQLCQTQANVIKLPIDPSKCTVQLEESAEVGQLSTGTLTRLNNNIQAKRNCKVTSQLRSLHNGAITDCNIVEDGSGRYSIQYTPTVRGRHELIISVDGQHVAGSPFSVFVSIPPTQLGRPVKVWKGISRLTGVTVNSKGDILLCEETGSIVKLDANGTVEKLVTQTELKVLIGIAVDNEDIIYCIDNRSDKILTCDEKGRNVKTHLVKLEGGGGGRLGLGISNNYLFISERGYKDTILVYNRELTYVRRIQHRDMGQVRATSSDVHGNIYTTSSNNTALVFNANGDFLRSLHNDKTQQKGPWGVCVFGPHVYVTANYSISVFTTDGVLITSFGKLGFQEGEFISPGNLCTDNDGFLYVCDRSSNSRIQCF